MEKPNCEKCKHRNEIPGSVHSGCKKWDAKVEGDEHGIKKGWFIWPHNFDPIWLRNCDSFEEIKS